MEIWKYKNYDEYVAEQTRGNKQKLNWVYVNENVIKYISDKVPTAQNIICHGTRNGAEQKFFKKYNQNAYVIGTEISETANKFEMTVQHDFSIPKDEWVNKFDIVYSNAFDHSFDPYKTIITWKNQLSDNGLLFIEYSEKQSVCEPVDCLSASLQEIVEIIEKSDLIITERYTKNVKHNGVVLVCENKKS